MDWESLKMGSSKCELENSSIPLGKSTFSSRQECFDTLKFFLAFGVVILHTGFTGYIGLGICALVRVAVPLFFMITGYYLPLMTDEKFRKHLKKVIWLTVFSTLFYFLYSYVGSRVGSDISPDWLLQTFNIRRIAKWLLFNELPFVFHLWYFYALLYVFVILYIIRKWERMDMAYRVLPFLFLGNYLLSFLGRCIYYRNFLFTGLLYVLLGCLFRNYEKRLLEVFHKSRTLILGLVVLCVCLGMEMIVYKWAGFNVGRDHYLFTLPMVACIFILCLRQPHWGKGSFLALVGKKYSAYIYIFHVFIMACIQYVLKSVVGKEIYQDIIQNNLFRYCYPFLVFGATLISVMIGYKVWFLFFNKFTSTIFPKKD